MSACVWDTTLASRLRPGAELLDDVNLRARRGEPVGIATISVLEISYGLSKAAQAGRSDFVVLQAWFVDFLRSGTVRALALGTDGALLAGEVRARLPLPPVRRPRSRSKAEARVAWDHDIQIACTAWEAGHDIVTADAGHFDVIAGCVNALTPGGPPLTVHDQPPLGDRLPGGGRFRQRKAASINAGVERRCASSRNMCTLGGRFKRGMAGRLLDDRAREPR